ncbi:hypothetical protein ACOMHN_020494 [Nucella lapillus]
MCSKAYALISLVDPVVGRYWQQRHLALVLGSYLAFVAISNIITAIIAMERCLCVLNPLKAAKFFRTKHMKVLIAVVAVYILIVNNVALLVKYQTVRVTNPLTNTTTFINRFTSFYVHHRTFLDILALYSISVALRLLSLIVVIICTTAIILRLKVTAAWRRSTASNMTSVEKQEASMTRMLMTVCCVYVMCMTPSATRTLLINILPGFLSIGHLCNSYRVSTSLALLLEAFNGSINFLIYVKQSSQYRSTLRQLCYRVRQQTASDTGTLVFVVDPVAGSYWQQRHQAVVLGSYLASVTISNIITTIIAMERCLCVLNPLKTAKFFKTKYMSALIMVAALYNLIVQNVALSTKCQTVQVFDPLTNTTTFIFRLSPFYLRHKTALDILPGFMSIVFRVFSSNFVIVCTTAIILRLSVNATWRRTTASNMTSVEKQEVSMTRMLVTVCCVYAMCMTPAATAVHTRRKYKNPDKFLKLCSTGIGH